MLRFLLTLARAIAQHPVRQTATIEILKRNNSHDNPWDSDSGLARSVRFEHG